MCCSNYRRREVQSNEVSNTYPRINYYRFDVDEQLAKGRTTLQSTLDWWGRQDKSVRDEALGDEDRTPVMEVLKH